MSKTPARHTETAPGTQRSRQRIGLPSRLRLAPFALLLGALLLPRAALAQPAVPLACAAGASKLALKYDKGLVEGKQKADSLFASGDVAKSPDKLRKKLNRVLDRLYVHVRDAWDQDKSEGRRCRVQGIAEGFVGRLSQLLGECLLDGAQWGQFSATLYCELSVELGGLAESTAFLRVPPGLCGSLFEQFCDDSYAYIASEGRDPLQSGARLFVEQRGLALQPYAGCEPYTQGEFETRFRESMNIDCSYGAP